MVLMRLVLESGALIQPRLLARDVQLYHLAEYLTASLIYFMLVFSPWTFGTTEPWSIRTMNVCGYGLGLLLIVKWTIRWAKGYHPGRWSEETGKAGIGKSGNRETRFTTALGMLTVAILSYCLLAAVNARATFNPALQTFEYHDCVLWLPHSFDSGATWDAFWTYAALACSFWSVRDWLLGKSMHEHHSQQLTAVVPVRLRRLLWVLIISGGLLGLEGIAQRLSDSPKLLFLVKPEIHQSALTQFASYAYRANAAQYFNLLWPVALGFWSLMHRSGRSKSITRHILLLGALIMAACPIISTARGAAIVDAAMLLAAALLLVIVVFFFNYIRCRASSAAWVIFFLVGALALGMGLGWNQLRPRLGDLSRGIDKREQLYERAHLIARDYPLFGTGPGTFDRVFQLYRIATDVYWPAQLHNDWLETRLTFGWIGSALIALALSTVFLRGFLPGGIRIGTHFILLMWLALAGCLVQARWDFPLQVYSILFLFLVWCAVLLNLSLRE